MARKRMLSMTEAWQAMLDGGHVMGKEVTEGTVFFCRLQAQREGREFIDSGIGDYRSYYLGRSAQN